MPTLINWLIRGGLVTVGGFIGFIISQGLAFYTFTENLKTTKEIEMVHLARDLTNDFYGKTEAKNSFRDIRTAIERCDKLYKTYDKDGRFDNEQINSYLGFFDDIGFFYKKGALDIATVKQLFGAHLIEAYENDELRRYMEDLQKNFKQPSAFGNFIDLANKLEENPEYRELIEIARRGCSKH